MKIGEWVFFKTHNWPKVSVTGDAAHVTDEGLYSGRGKIVGIVGNIYTVREETANRLVEVGPHPDDQVRSLGVRYTTLTLGHLRTFLEQHKNVPDDIPVTIALPLNFFSDLDEMPPDHPEFKAVSECQIVDACEISIMGYTDDGAFMERYVPPAEREKEDWDFSVEIVPHPEQCFEAMRKVDE
ncbi:MAG: hypothetical protein ACYC0X_12935 [Pirellulaceae bacterium]